MTFTYCKYKNIDKAAWDEVITNSTQPFVYGLSWYLDLVCQTWDAILITENSEYKAVFPIPITRLGVFKYSSQPYFTQQLGWFALPNIEIPNITRTKDFLLKSGIRYGAFQLNNTISDTNLENKKTFVLELNHNYDLLSKNYSSQRKRDLKKSVKHDLSVTERNHSLRFEDRYHEIMKSRLSIDLKMKTIFDNLVKVLSKKGKALFVEVRADKEIHAEAIFVKSFDRLIYLAGYSSEVGRNSGAMTMLFDYIIKTQSGVTLDFEGGNITSIGKFFASFGAIEEVFYSYKFNDLPWLLRKVKK